MKKVEISKDDLRYNLKYIKERLNGKSDLIVVVKINGMGMDLVKYTKFLSGEGVNFFAVANSYDAITLRKNGIDKKILLMSEVINKQELTDLIKNDIILTIGNLEEKQLIQEIAKSLEKSVEAHIKIDTGFARYGFLYNDKDILEAVKPTENLKITGCFTHFSDPSDKNWTNIQFSRFKNLIPKIKEINSEVKFHCCASTTFLSYEEMWLDYVRVGSCMIGRIWVDGVDLRKIGKFKTEIITIKNVPKGYNISYNNEYKIKKDSKIAVIGVRLY